MLWWPYTLARPPESLRVAVLGSAVVYGMSMSLTDTNAAVVEGELQAAGHRAEFLKSDESLCSIPVGGGQPRLRWHPLGRNHQHLPPVLHHQLAQVVQQVIHLGVAQVGELDLARCAREPAGDLAVDVSRQRSA